MAGKLLTDGNEKLGPGIGGWSIPSVATCPGRSKLCEALCYASRFENRWKIDYGPKFEAAKSSEFVSRMVEEARWRTVVRVHVSGDFFEGSYVDAWAEVARRCPGTKFYAYTRSWREPAIRERLEEFGRLKNVRLLFSCDRETGIPPGVPARRLVWMATDDSDRPPRKVRIVFRVKRTTVMAKMAESIVCPKENGIKNAVTCGRCQLCFK